MKLASSVALILLVTLSAWAGCDEGRSQAPAEPPAVALGSAAVSCDAASSADPSFGPSPDDEAAIEAARLRREREARALLRLTPSEAAPVRARIAGVERTLSHGLAYTDDGGMHLYLTSKPVACGPPLPRDAYRAHLKIPPGPGHRYFEGGAVGVTTFFEGPGVGDRTSADGTGEVVLAVAAVGPRVRVGGTRAG